MIFNTLSITVAQRTREFATLRTLGASRKQVMRSVVLEGLVIGFVASLIGLLAGFGIYKGLNALFVALGADLPKSGTVIAHADDHRLAAARHDRDADREHPARAGAPRGCRRSRRSARAPSCREPRLAAHSAKLALGVIVASVAAISVGVFASVGTLGVVLLLGFGVIGLFIGVALARSAAREAARARWSAGPAVAPAACRASWRARTRSATRAARPRRPPR